MKGPNILVVQTGFLGDVVLSSPVLTNLRNIYPNARISLLTTPVATGLMKYHPSLDEVLVFEKRGVDGGLRGLWRMAKKLRRGNFAVVFSLHKSWRTALLLWLSKIPERVGFREASGWFLYSKTVSRSEYSHDAERNTAILKAIGFAPSELDTALSLGTSSEEEGRADQLLKSAQGEPLIGIAPGSVWATKRWTVEGFSAVAKQLSDDGFKIVLLGGVEDLEAGLEISRVCGNNVIQLIGQTTLGETIAIVKNLSLLITNDSAPLHIASACKTPVVAIFCATVPEFGYGPWKTEAETVGVDGLSCRPCGRHGGQKCPTGTHACQLQLSDQQVLSAVNRVLARTFGKNRRPVERRL